MDKAAFRLTLNVYGSAYSPFLISGFLWTKSLESRARVSAIRLVLVVDAARLGVHVCIASAISTVRIWHFEFEESTILV